MSGIAYFWLAVGFLFAMLGGLIFVFSLQPEGGDRRYAYASWLVSLFFNLLAAWTFWRGI